MTVAPSLPRRSARLLITCAALACTAPAQVMGYAPRLTPAAGDGLPNPIEWVLDEAATALAVGTAPTAPPALLLAARNALRDGAPVEREWASLVLGFHGDSDDRVLLEKAARDGDQTLAWRGLVGLGLLGGAAARLVPASVLAHRDAVSAHKAVAAFALGVSVTEADRGGSSQLKSHALSLLALSRSRHAAEIAACFAGFPPDEGRAVLTEYLEQNANALPLRRHVPADTTFRGLALAALASRFATDEEWILVRQGLRSPKSAMRRFKTAWGLYRHSGKGPSDRTRSKVARALADLLDDRHPEVRSMAFLALARFDEAHALRRARGLLRSGRIRPGLLAAAFVIVGSAGDKSDIELLRGYERKNLDGTQAAAWCLGTASLCRRAIPEAWPHSKFDDGAPPFPLEAIRTRIGTHIAPAGSAQAACAVALAMLGDRASVFRLRELLWTASDDDTVRLLALALLRIDPAALNARHRDPSHAAEADDAREQRRLTAWSHAAAPQLWPPLVTKINAAAAPGERAEYLRLAALALASPHGRLDRRLRERLGPGPLPEPLNTILGWR